MPDVTREPEPDVPDAPNAPNAPNAPGLAEIATHRRRRYTDPVVTSPGKRKTREIALQVLFAWDANGEPDEPMALRIAQEAAPEDVDARLRGLEWAQSAWATRETIDAQLERLAPQWPPRRQPAVDRNILRLAAWELGGAATPPKVVIDEAIELAKQFSTENSPSFINGVLDAVLREHQALTGGETERRRDDEPK